jgi:hypothetical protein
MDAAFIADGKMNKTVKVEKEDLDQALRKMIQTKPSVEAEPLKTKRKPT